MATKFTLLKKSSTQSAINTAQKEENVENFQQIISVMKEEYSDYKLTKEMRQQLQNELNVTDETASNWQSVVDVLDHIDLTELARKHPEEIGKAAKTITSIVGCVFAPVGVAGNLIPEDAAAKIIEYSGMLLPTHIVNRIAKKQLENKNNNEEKKAPQPISNLFSKIKKPSKQTEPDNIEKLKQLAELRDTGVITDEEYDAKKTELLSKI